MNAWERQRTLARTTTVWGTASLAVGAVLAARADPWWRAFGQQHVGWGAVDLGIVAVLNTLQVRRQSRLSDPCAPVALERERRRLRKVLLVNAAADAGYVVGGLTLWQRRRHDPRAAGAGVAIAIQGVFLLVHDSYHGLRSSRHSDPDLTL